jgi:signal transduction histidine kinase
VYAAALKTIPIPAALLIYVSVYSLARWGKRLAAYAAAVAIAFALVVVALTMPSYGPWSYWPMAALLSAFAFIPWTAGIAGRLRTDHGQAARRAGEAQARDRAQLAELAAASERNRIAREMHDIVAHSLSVVIAQADGGLYASKSDPTAATKALTTIAETGRAALADMRRILGVLRHPEDREQGGLREPTPDSQDLAALVAQMRETGLDIAMVRVGIGSTLPPGVGLVLYRICQEALTNVLKHAGPGVHVTLIDRWEPRQVTLEIRDDGRGAAAPPSDGPGHGLLGMRERAEMLGGSLEAGPGRTGGFAVTARIPLPESTQLPPTGPSGILSLDDGVAQEDPIPP